jgi:hypothetical protein
MGSYFLERPGGRRDFSLPDACGQYKVLVELPIKGHMVERRTQPRMLCADLVDVRWKDKGGRTRRSVANLEDISQSGVCLQVDMQIPKDTVVRITYPRGEFLGQVRYCTYKEIGYFVGVEFTPGVKWSQRSYKPMHLLDPRALIRRATRRLNGAQGEAPRA